MSPPWSCSMELLPSPSPRGTRADAVQCRVPPAKCQSAKAPSPSPRDLQVLTILCSPCPPSVTVQGLDLVVLNNLTLWLENEHSLHSGDGEPGRRLAHTHAASQWIAAAAGHRATTSIPPTKAPPLIVTSRSECMRPWVPHRSRRVVATWY